jgi:hypothetical protein
MYNPIIMFLELTSLLEVLLEINIIEILQYFEILQIYYEQLEMILSFHLE